MKRFYFAWLVATAFFPAAAGAAPCAMIYYDRVDEATYTEGKVYAVFLANLLGHFPKYQVLSQAVEDYRPGDLEKCQASFYLGSHFDAKLPEAFLRDFVATEKPFLWMGYGYWKLNEAQQRSAFGFSYRGLTGLNSSQKDEQGRPTFFRNIEYQGETFSKYGDFSPEDPSRFDSSPELTALEAMPPPVSSADVLATAIHNGSKQRIPYAIRKGNRFYVADIPFT
jgi:uncharacterized protein YdaL